jgi:hypothetical protein
MKGKSMKVSGQPRFLGAFAVFSAVVGVLLVTARADEPTTPTVEALPKQSVPGLSSGCAASGCRPSIDPVRWSSVAATDIGTVFMRAQR